MRDFRDGTAEEGEEWEQEVGEEDEDEDEEGELFGSHGQSAYKIGSSDDISNSFNNGASPSKTIRSAPQG